MEWRYRPKARRNADLITVRTWGQIAHTTSPSEKGHRSQTWRNKRSGSRRSIMLEHSGLTVSANWAYIKIWFQQPTDAGGALILRLHITRIHGVPVQVWHRSLPRRRVSTNCIDVDTTMAPPHRGLMKPAHAIMFNPDLSSTRAASQPLNSVATPAPPVIPLETEINKESRSGCTGIGELESATTLHRKLDAQFHLSCAKRLEELCARLKTLCCVQVSRLVSFRSKAPRTVFALASWPGVGQRGRAERFAPGMRSLRLGRVGQPGRPLVPLGSCRPTATASRTRPQQLGKSSVDIEIVGAAGSGGRGFA